MMIKVDTSTQPPKTLLLVDGSSYLYRAFHALPDLRSPHGLPTGAIYGVLNMLRRAIANYPADYNACVFDAKGKTFRDAWYPQYKAHRPPMPTDLAAQIEPLHQAIAASGWNVLMIDGVEADDVIGTLALQATHGGARCIISTGDKDLTQLVNSQVQLVNTMTDETLDEAGVLAKFGVRPDQIVDYLSLIGDTVDNVPGVTKVGPKTALKWLEQYGSLNNVMLHAQEIGGVVGQNLRDALEWLPQGRKLVTVKCDVTLPVHFDALQPPPHDAAQLRNIYERCGFKSWLRELNNSIPSNVAQENSGSFTLEKSSGLAQKEGRDFAASSYAASGNEASASPLLPSSGEYETILIEAQLDVWLKKMMQAELVCVDTETTGLDVMNAQLVGISFAITPHHAAYLPLAHHYPGAPEQLQREHALQKLRPWLESAQHKKLGQNLKYDQHIFANHGINLAGVAEDTLLQSYVLESHRPHDMDNLAHRHLNIKTISYAEVVGKGAKQISFGQVDLTTATRYAAEDADITLQLHQTLSPQLKAQGKLDAV
ncbi:MAG: 5'-3' exonuclease H3TH domain-containing protein, partial [Candidatus Nitrotoga sp.]